MEICRGTLQPKKPQEVPWKCAVVLYLAARPQEVPYVEVLPGGTLQPKKPQEVPWKYAVVSCSQAPGGALHKRCSQRGPERPREAQRASERHRDAQRGPERPREAQTREAQRG